MLFTQLQAHLENMHTSLIIANTLQCVTTGSIAHYMNNTLGLLQTVGSIAGIIAAATTSLHKQANTTQWKIAPSFKGFNGSAHQSIT